VNDASVVADRNPLLASPILPILLRLSLPNMASMLATTLVAIAETVYVGRLGTEALAGMALVFPMVMLQQMMSSGAMGGGVSSAVARALGGGDVAHAQLLVFHAATIGLIAGLGFTILFLMFGSEIFQLLGGRDGPLREALAYSNVIFLGATGIWLTNSFASVIRGTGNMKVPSATLFIISGAQVVIGGGFGLGIGPLPRLGMAGVAMGQAVSFSLGALFLFWFLSSGHCRVTLKLRGNTLRRDMFNDILKVGALACISPMQSILAILILTRLVAYFGTEALAGYGIGTRLEFLTFPVTFAFGVACVPLVGMAIGARNPKRARRVAWTASAVSMVTLGTIGSVVTVMPDLWATLFTQNPGVLASAHSYLQWSGPGYGFFSVGLCLYFASQGAGKVLGPVIAGTVRLALIAGGGWYLAVTDAPVAWLFALIGFGMVVYGGATALAVYITPWPGMARR
jgi:putative MATE family efflux protein